MGKRILVYGVFEVAALSMSGTAFSQELNPPPQVTLSYQITACIDDHDILLFQGDTLQWEHLNDSTPGQHPGCGGEKATRIVVMRQVEGRLPDAPKTYSWFPDFGGGLNADHHPASYSFQMDPSDTMPHAIPPGAFSYSKSAGRGTITPTVPTDKNGWTARAEIEDPQPGPDTYQFTFTVKVP